MEDIKTIVRKIRAGESVEGACLDGDVLAYNGRSYKVQGTERLRVVEVDAQKPTKAKKESKVKEPTRDLEGKCSSCGESFTVSKFNPYMTECPACRRKSRATARSTGGNARQFTCSACGSEFYVSKFQPYLNPEKCPHCTRLIARAKQRELKKAILGAPST